MQSMTFAFLLESQCIIFALVEYQVYKILCILKIISPMIQFLTSLLYYHSLLFLALWKKQSPSSLTCVIFSGENCENKNDRLRKPSSFKR